MAEERHGADGDGEHGRDGPDHQERATVLAEKKPPRMWPRPAAATVAGEGATHAG